MKRIYVIEDLCNGCLNCQTFCSSLKDGVFNYGAAKVRIKVLKIPGEERDIPIVDCNGKCLRPLFEDGWPTCVSICPTGALIYCEQDEAVSKRLELELARKNHKLFKILAPWKWPFPWKKAGIIENVHVRG
jgi:Fe-S-cluster-containing dehydrogenase component